MKILISKETVRSNFSKITLQQLLMSGVLEVGKSHFYYSLQNNNNDYDTFQSTLVCCVTF